MEVPAENLVATVNRFNDFARNGHDDDFIEEVVPTIITTGTRHYQIQI